MSFTVEIAGRQLHGYTIKSNAKGTNVRALGTCDLIAITAGTAGMLDPSGGGHDQMVVML